jgi:hypothetical protein
MYTSAQGIDDELGYTDEDSAYTLITNAQYLLAIAHDYQVDVFRVTPLLQVVLHAVRIVDVEEAAFGSPEDLGVVCYRFAFGRGVDHGEHLLEVVQDELRSGQLCHTTSISGNRILYSIALHSALLSWS